VNGGAESPERQKKERFAGRCGPGGGNKKKESNAFDDREKVVFLAGQRAKQ